MEPLAAKELDLSNLHYDFPQKHSGYHLSPITYNKEALVIQSPPLELITKNKNVVELGFGRKTSEGSKKFYHSIYQLEQYTIKTISESSKNWFGREIPFEKVRQMYKTCIHPPKTIDGNTTLRLRLSNNFKISTDENEDLDIETVNLKNIRFYCICKIDGLLFGKNTTKLDIKIMQMRAVLPKVQKPPPPPPQDDADSEINDEDDYFGKVRTEQKESTESTSTEVPETTEENLQPNLEETKNVELSPEASKNIPASSLVQEDLQETFTKVQSQLKEALEQGDTKQIQELAKEMEVLKTKIGTSN